MEKRSSRPRLALGVVLLALFSAFSFGAIVRVALADHWHTNCVAHGFMHGDSTTDGSFFARVEPGCGSTLRRCELYTHGSFDGDVTVAGTTATCSAWSRAFGDYTECASTAHVYSSGVFNEHVHKAHNWCG
jgi:hypothetical protein